jgi:hypothetical protein
MGRTPAKLTPSHLNHQPRKGSFQQTALPNPLLPRLPEYRTSCKQMKAEKQRADDALRRRSSRSERATGIVSWKAMLRLERRLEGLRGSSGVIMDFQLPQGGLRSVVAFHFRPLRRCLRRVDGGVPRALRVMPSGSQ